ncbi:MAG: mechanosensitive ion channel domain-containing protein [Candidatus Glassbacteria bacterium]
MLCRFTFAVLILLLAPSFPGRQYLPAQITGAAAAFPADSLVSQSAGSEKLAPVKEALEATRPRIQWGISFGKVVWAALIFFIALILITYINRFLGSIAERWTNLRLFIKRLIPILRILGWTFVIYVIIVNIFAPPVETLIAATASAGIAIGFASQDILKNIFGGIMILFDRPFQVGDKIQVGTHYGEVVQIGLRTARIVTADDSMVSIPNSEIVNQSVSNSNSGEFNCQVVAEFYLPLNIDLIRLKKIAYLAAAVSQYAFLNKPVTVIIKNEIYEGRSLLKVRLKAYVLDLRYEFQFASEMTETVISELLRQKMVTSEDLAFVGDK